MTGSTRAAPRAGTAHARSPAIVTARHATANDTGSVGGTPKTNVAMTPLSPSAAPVPSATPIPIIQPPCRRNIRITPAAEAPSAIATVAVVTAVLFGAAPAWHALTSAPASSLRAHGAAGETRSRRLFGRSLVVAPVAFSVVLLSAAGLFVHHLSSLRNQDFGFQRSRLLVVTLDPSKGGYPGDQLFSPYQDLLRRLEAIPGVRSVTLTAVTPISGAGASRFIRVEGVDEDVDARRYVPLNWVGPRYFKTLGTPLLAGREFTFADRAGPPVAIVNQAMARYYFGDRNPIGGRFQFVGPSSSGITGAPADRVYEIVGVAGDAKYLDLREVPRCSRSRWRRRTCRHAARQAWIRSRRCGSDRRSE
jgi:putative ABC transport system permease protein